MAGQTTPFAGFGFLCVAFLSRGREDVKRLCQKVSWTMRIPTTVVSTRARVFMPFCTNSSPMHTIGRSS